jgi:hypothetical protein
MKPGLDQTTVVTLQRLAGALIGAVVAALLLLIATDEHGLKLISVRHALEVVAIVIIIHGVAIRFWNTRYTPRRSPRALLATDLPHQSNYPPRDSGCSGRWSAWP